MSLGYATDPVSCNQPTAFSEIDLCEDSALFSRGIASLYEIGESRSATSTDCAESPGTVHIQNDRDGGATDAHVPIYQMLSRTSGFQSHCCRAPNCAMGRILNASQCRSVIIWFPSAAGAELFKATLQGTSAGCSEHANGNAGCCSPEKTDACCMQCPKGSEYADQSFFAAKSCYDHDQCPATPDGTLNPSTLSLFPETTDISQSPFKCDYPACNQGFKRQATLGRHRKKHIGERLHVCWVPGCQRSFWRSDNLKAHYTTHGTHGGRNLYVATLDKAVSVYDPNFRGQLTPQGWPLGDAA